MTVSPAARAYMHWFERYGFQPDDLDVTTTHTRHTPHSRHGTHTPRHTHATAHIRHGTLTPRHTHATRCKLSCTVYVSSTGSVQCSNLYTCIAHATVYTRRGTLTHMSLEPFDSLTAAQVCLETFRKIVADYEALAV